MAKSTKVSKKAKAQAEAPAAVAPIAAAAPVVQAEPKKTGRKQRSQDTPDEAKARWARRLARWSKKAEAAGVDARALMQAALAA